MTPTSETTPRSLWREIATGVATMAPVLVVYVPVAMAYGVLAVESGLAPWLTVLMSVLIFAGTVQLASVQMFALGLPPASIVITAFVINARYIAMSSALVPYLRHWRLWQRILYGVQLADANFAIHIARLSSGERSLAELFTANIVGYLVWLAATVAGIAIGRSADNLEAFAIDFAMPAMFIGLLVPLIRSRSQAAVAVGAGAAMLAFHAAGLAFWAILLATGVGLVVGLVGERWTK